MVPLISRGCAMPRIAGRLLFILSFALLVCAVHAQVGVATSGGPDHTSPPHQLQPYTAEFKITQVQTLADGTTITVAVEKLATHDRSIRNLILNSGTH